MKSRAAVVLTLVVLATAWGCARKAPAAADSLVGRVALDEPGRSSPQMRRDRDADREVRPYPATYSEAILPDYPEGGLDSPVATVRVRVDFHIGRDGLAHDAVATVLDETAAGALFAAASKAVLPRWRFSPSWRLTADIETAPDSLILLESRAHLVFRFDLEAYREGRKVEVQFDQ